MKPVAAAGAASLALLAASPAFAQMGGYAGQWGCQSSYTELNPQGQRTSGFTRQYTLWLYGNGAYQVQGTEAGASGYSQFRSQGQWQQSPAGVIARGPEQSTNSMGLQMEFIFAATLDPGGQTMRSSYEQPDPYRQYVMNRSLVQCQRQQ